MLSKVGQGGRGRRRGEPTQDSGDVSGGDNVRAMMTNRREFLGQVAAVAAVAGPAMSTLGAQNGRLTRLGMQLYTVRNEMAKDFEGTLAKVAALGFKEVEFAGYFDRTPQAVRATLDKLGLTAPSTHIDLATITDKLPQVIESSRIIGHKYIVLPWLDDNARKDPGIWQRVADTLNKASETAKPAGITMAYHNHHFEFAPGPGGQLPLDFLLGATAKSGVVVELDLAWITAAGQDPVAFFKKYPGRFPMVHVKGLAKLTPNGATRPINELLPDIADVGGDAVNWGRIFANASTGGIQHYFVEHDNAKDPLASLASSYKYLQGLRF